MSDTGNTSGSSSFPLLGLLGIVFITLKLTDHIDWSWWWVLAPFWGPFALLAAVLFISGLIVLGKHR